MFWQKKKKSIFLRVSCDFLFSRKMALNYLNDAYKRAIIESQGQEEISLDVANSLNVSYDIQPLKMQKTKQFLGVGELGKHCKPALVPFVGLQNMVRL